jgi:hypothetical protein
MVGVMAELPTLACPKCRGALEYHATIELVNTPIGKIDTGYCHACARLFERVRETNKYYDSTAWPPLCRSCRQPVTFTSLWADADQHEQLLYECRDHPAEQWMLTRGNNWWKRISAQ